MKIILVSSFILVALSVFNSVDAAADEYMKVKCILFDHNKIEVRLNKQSVAAAKQVADAGNIDHFRSYMKDVVKNVPQQNHACAFGWIGEQDFTTATAMFVSGINEFILKANMIGPSGYTFLYMTTERGKNYDPTYGHFYLSF